MQTMEQLRDTAKAISESPGTTVDELREQLARLAAIVSELADE